jgi:hypothetical protein
VAARGVAQQGTERRQYWIAGTLLFVVIVGLIVASALTASGPRHDPAGTLQEQGGAKPHIIPRPDEGQAPKHPNDRGGSEQFLVLGLMVAGVGCIGLLGWRSSRRARAGRQSA